ncbi:MAG TPA: hypothetical protein VD969_00210 [Symbiobacteriaceae bacterium]|nr:hypothetical protein [Symbiobacteriaceae bacterium]
MDAIKLSDVVIGDDSLQEQAMWELEKVKVERAYHQDDGGCALFKALKWYVQKRSRYWHYKSARKIDQDDFAGCFWEEVAKTARDHHRVDGFFLLDKVRKRIHCRAVEEIRHINRECRRPAYFSTVPLDSILDDDETRTKKDKQKLLERLKAAQPTPDEVVVSQETVWCLVGLLTDQERQGLALRLSGHSNESIAAVLWPDKKPHSERTRRLFDGIRQRLTECA